MKVPILMYHRVAENSAASPWAVSTTLFEQQMRALKDLNYHVVSLDEVIATLEGKTTLPSKSVAITFDDGFRDTYENASPVLTFFGFGATFFLVSRLIGETSLWMGREGLPTADLINWANARELLRYGFALGSHSRTHPSLKLLEDAAIFDEIDGSKRDLEHQLGVPIRYFAYPYGHLDNRARDVVERSGYVAACSTQSGFNNVSTDRWGLRRLEINKHDSMRMFARSLTFGQNHMRMTEELNYYIRQAFGIIHKKGASFGA